MPDEDIEIGDSTNPASEEDVNTEDVEETSAQEETEDTSELKEKNQRLYERAKKAEAEAKALRAQLKPSVQTPTPSGRGTLTVETVRELKAVSDLADEDAEYVVNYADKFGIRISEARKLKDVQAVLQVRAEERRTADATSTGNSRRGTSKVSDDTLLERAATGDVPDDEESLRRIVKARFKNRAS